jgi:predicted nucleic acid-binding protein
LVRVVVDANVLFAALKDTTGGTAVAMRQEDVQLFAPDWLLQEAASFRATLQRRTGMEDAEFDRRLAALLDLITIIAKEEWGPAGQHALVTAVTAIDPKDGPYAACLVAAQADFLWTRDDALRKAMPGRAVFSLPSAGVLPPSS